MFRKHGSVILEESWSVVIDVLNNDGQGRCCSLGRIAIVNGQNLDEMFANDLDPESFNEGNVSESNSKANIDYGEANYESSTR